MKAIIYNNYGSADVLQLAEVEKPKPKENEVLIKIKATTVNRTDCGFRSPEYFIVRLISGLFKPKKKILGSEFSGEVVELGKSVKSFSIGDRVFGLSTYNFGTHAEYICIAEHKSITKIPNNISYEEAAAVSDGMMLAYANLRKLDFSKPLKIMVYGATGSIGTSAVQLAKHFGASVTAVGNTKNVELLKSLGADKVIDYTKENFINDNELYDVIFDAVGKTSFFKSKNLLKPKGIYYSTELGYMMQNIFLALINPIMPGKKVKFHIPTDSKEDMEFFASLLAKKKYKAVIDSYYSFEQIPDAHRYVDKGMKTGNVVIKL